MGSITAIGDRQGGKDKTRGSGEAEEDSEWSWRGTSRGGLTAQKGISAGNRLLKNPRELRDVQEG